MPPRQLRPQPPRVLLNHQPVTATPAALQTIQRLSAAHGPLILIQSGGCCDGSSLMCLRQGELPLSPHDTLLGTIANTPFYIDSDQYQRWNRPHLIIDVSPGATDGFSLEGSEGVHFVTVTRS